MQSRKSPQEVDELLKAQEESGLNKRQFCKVNSIKYTTFLSWIVKRNQNSQTTKSSFIKLPQAFARSDGLTGSQNYQLELGCYTLLVPVGFNVSELEALVGILTC